MTISNKKQEEKYMDVQNQKMIDERGRIWFMTLGKLTNMDIDDADRGLMNLKAIFDFGSSGQGIQCILDGPFKNKKGRYMKRLGTVFAAELIRQLITTFDGVNSLSDFNNKYWYALYRTEPRWGSMGIDGIAHPINKRQYIIWKDVIEEVKGLDWTVRKQHRNNDDD